MRKHLQFRRFYYAFIFAFVSFSAFGQQQFHLTQYMMNPYLLNPAVGGIEGDLDIRTGGRQQWLNYPGAPRTYYLSGNSRIKVLTKPSHSRKSTPFHSIGGIVYQDEAGPLKRNAVLAAYSYSLPLTNNLNMSLGASAGITKMYLDYSALKFDQDGEVINYSNTVLPDGNIGLWLYNTHFFVGLSLNQLFMNELNFVQDQGSDVAHSQLVPHYYFTNGYNIPLGYASGKHAVHEYYLVPSFMIKYTGKTAPSFDLNLKIKKKDVLWLGVSYRRQDAIAFLGGITLLNTGKHFFEVGYSYDRTISALRSGSYGSHEVILIYKLKEKKKVVCPENFW